MLTLIALASATTWLIVLTFMMTTKNFRSAFLFQLLPFCIAMACAVAFLAELGWIIPPK